MKYEHTNYGPIFKRKKEGFIFSHIGIMTKREVQVSNEATAFLLENFNNTFEEGKANE